MNENCLIYKVHDINFNDISADNQTNIKSRYEDFLCSVEDRETHLIVLYNKVPETDIKEKCVLSEKEDEYKDLRDLYNKRIIDYVKGINRIKKEIFLMLSKKEDEDCRDMIEVNMFEAYLRYIGVQIENVSRIDNIMEHHKKEYHINSNNPIKIKQLIDLAASIDTEQLMIDIHFKRLSPKDVVRHLLKKGNREEPYQIYYETDIKLSVHAGSDDKLATVCKELKKMLCDEHIQYRSQCKYFSSGKNTIYSIKELSEIIPFSNYDSPNSGFIYGCDKNNNLFWIDRKKLLSPNAIILSNPKDKTELHYIHEMEQVLLSTEDDIIVIDIEGYSYDFAKKYNSNHISIGPEDRIFSNQLIDYEDYNGHIDLTSRKKEFICSIFDVLNDESLTTRQHSLLWPYLDEAIISAKANDSLNEKEERRIPTLHNLLEVLRRTENKEVEYFANILDLGLNLYPVLSAEEQLNYKSSRFTIYDISKLSGKNKTLAYIVLFEKIYNQMIINSHVRKYTWIYLDSIELLYETYSGMDHLTSFYKRARMRYGIPTLCVRISDIIDSLRKTGTLDLIKINLLLNNSNVIEIFNSNQEGITELADSLNISKTQMRLANEEGSFIMCCGNNIVNLKNTF